MDQIYQAGWHRRSFDNTTLVPAIVIVWDKGIFFAFADQAGIENTMSRNPALKGEESDERKEWGNRIYQIKEGKLILEKQEIL